MRLSPTSAAALAASLAALPANAHPGDHAQAAASHLLASPDHLVMIVMAVAIVALPVARLALVRVRR